MGLFDSFGDFIDGLVEAVSDGVEWISDKVGDVVNFISETFGSNKPYEGTSAEEVVDVQQELKAFRDKIEKRAQRSEEDRILRIARKFDSFIVELEEIYPNEAEAVHKKWKATFEGLRGTILEFIEQRISENDPDFLKLLEMQPGSAKTKAINRQIKKMLKEAQWHFKNRLGDDIQGLSQDLGGRLTSELHRHEEQLKEETAIYEDLEQRSRNGNIDLVQLEAEYCPIVEAEACIQAVLAVK